MSTIGSLNDIEGAMDGAIEVKQDGKIIFQKFNSYCDDIWCFPFYTLSFWLKYEELANQDILALGDLVKVTQTSSLPTDYLTIELNSTTEECFTSFFVPTEVWSHIIVTFNRGLTTLYLNGRVLATSLTCTQKTDMEDYSEVQLMAGGSGDVYFGLDDVRLLFDIQLHDTVRSYKEKTGMLIMLFLRENSLNVIKLLQGRSQNFQREGGITFVIFNYTHTCMLYCTLAQNSTRVLSAH